MSLEQIALFRAKELHEIELSSRPFALRPVNADILESLVEEFRMFGVDKVRLGIPQICVEGQLPSESFHELKGNGLKAAYIWNMTDDVRNRLKVFPVFNCSGPLRMFNFSDGRHRLASVKMFVNIDKIMTAEEYNNSYYQIRVTSSCDVSQARVISLKLSRSVLSNAPCITDVFRCLPKSGTMYSGIKHFIAAEENVRRLLLPDSESLKKVCMLSYALFPEVKALMETYRSTNMFQTHIFLQRKSFLASMAGLENRNLFTPKKNRGRVLFSCCTTSFKKKAQLAVVATAIGINVVTFGFRCDTILHRTALNFVADFPKDVQFTKLGEDAAELLIWKTLVEVVRTRFLKSNEEKLPGILRSALSALTSVSKTLFSACNPNSGGVETLLSIELDQTFCRVSKSQDQGQSPAEQSSASINPVVENQGSNQVSLPSMHESCNSTGTADPGHKEGVTITNPITQDRRHVIAANWSAKVDAGDEERTPKVLKEGLKKATSMGGSKRTDDRREMLEGLGANNFTGTKVRPSLTLRSPSSLPGNLKTTMNERNAFIKELVLDIVSQALAGASTPKYNANQDLCWKRGPMAHKGISTPEPEGSKNKEEPEGSKKEDRIGTITVIDSSDESLDARERTVSNSGVIRIVSSSDENSDCDGKVSPRTPEITIVDIRDDPPSVRTNSNKREAKTQLRRKSKRSRRASTMSRSQCAFRCFRISQQLNDWFQVIGVHTKESESALFYVPDRRSELNVAFVDHNDFWRKGRRYGDVLQECAKKGLVFNILITMLGPTDFDDIEREITVSEGRYFKRSISILGSEEWDLFKNHKDILLCGVVYVRDDALSGERQNDSRNNQQMMTVWTHGEVDLFLRQLFRSAVNRRCILYDFTCSQIFLLSSLREDNDLIPLITSFYRALPLVYEKEYERSFEYLRSKCLEKCNCGNHEVLGDLPNSFEASANTSSKNGFFAAIGKSDELGPYDLISHASLLLRKLKEGGTPSVGNADVDLCGRTKDRNGARLEMGAFLSAKEVETVLRLKSRSRPIVLYPKAFLVDAEAAMKDFHEFLSPFDLKVFYVAGMTKQHLWYFMANESMGSMINSISSEAGSCLKLEENYRSVHDFTKLFQEGSGRFLKPKTSFLRISLQVSRLRRQAQGQSGPSYRCKECGAIELFTDYGENYFL